MRILRIRHGFQADHSSSSYLFYAIDRPVSAKGQQVAHRFSSRAEVDEYSARYQKWGESNLSYNAYKDLLSEHYDVMASESYDWWTLMIAVPKTPRMQTLLKPFQDSSDEGGTDVEDYGSRLVAVVSCSFDYGGPVFEHHEEPLERLVDLLVKIRAEILQGDVSFLQEVASFYGFDEDQDEEEPSEPEDRAEPPPGLPEGLTKADLQRECADRGIPFRKSWTKEQLRAAWTAAEPGPAARAKPSSKAKPAKLSRAAKEILESLDHR